MSRMQPWQPGLGVDRWAEVGDATMPGMQPWQSGLGVDKQRWEMLPCQGCSHGNMDWGWMDIGGRCSHARDAAMAAWVGGG
jgi:hypothetical protein